MAAPNRVTNTAGMSTEPQMDSACWKVSAKSMPLVKIIREQPMTTE